MGQPYGKPNQELVEQSSNADSSSAVSACNDEDRYRSERDEVMERFEALGGATPIEVDIERAGLIPEDGTIEACISPYHRRVVWELASSGISQDKIARIMGISRERLAHHFAYEIETAAETMLASINRSLARKALAGDTTAALGIMRGHPRSDWRSRQETSGSVSSVNLDVELDMTDRESAQALLKAMGVALNRRPDAATIPVAVVPKGGTKVPKLGAPKRSK